MQRGNDRSPLFADSLDFDCFLSCLTKATRTHAVAVHAYVLMTNHVHLLVTPQSRASLGKAMHWTGSVFAQQINVRYGRTGSRFEGRYKARFIQDETHFLTCMRYIEENPLRAGMVGAPGDYRWSSFRANALGLDDGLVTTHSIYERLADTPTDRIERYRALFTAPLCDAHVHAVRFVRLPRGRRPQPAPAL
jgi:putative transposase